MSAPTFKAGCAQFVAFVMAMGLFNFLRERYPQHRTAIWAVWLSLGLALLVAALVTYVPKLLTHIKQRRHSG